MKQRRRSVRRRRSRVVSRAELERYAALADEAGAPRQAFLARLALSMSEKFDDPVITLYRRTLSIRERSRRPIP